MALFNRFFGSQSSQSSQSSASVRRKGSEPSVWRQYYEAVPEPCDVRVVVFRQCERKGQKLLFDSSTVTRERLAGPGDVERPELYKEQSEGWGYRYLKAASDVRQLHDMIFGGAGVAHQDINMKLHQLDSGLMWSSVLQPPHPGRQPGQHQASDNSLGSSFGCSIGSFSRTDSSHEMFSGVMAPAWSLPTSDSGYYSHSSHSSHSCTSSFPSLDTDTDLASQTRRRLSSHADLPDYGSWCSLQRRWMSMVENSLSSHHTDSLSLKSGGRPSTVLGLALILQLPGEGEETNILLRQNLVLEDIFSGLCESVRQAYIHKRRFVSTVYAGYCECESAVRQLYTLPHLPSPAWHTALNDISLQDRLVQDLLTIRAELDTKETNFFFSCLVTGVLSHHLGWVETVMPSSRASQADNSLNKPGSRVVEEFSEQHWYSPTRLQHHELHGILGCPARNVKTLVITETEELARKVVFVLSYFIRCSQILERKLEFRESSGPTRKYRVRKGNHRDDQNYESPASCSSSKMTNIARSSSSPTLEPKMSKQSMKKSKSFICSLADLDQNKPQQSPSKLSDRDRVNFLIGDNENLNINPRYGQERFDSGLAEESLETDLESLELQQESSPPVMGGSDTIITKGVTTRMKAEREEEEEEEEVELTEVPLSSPDIQSVQPAALPSLLCCSDSFMPGSVLQAVTGPSWRSSLQSDLLATATNHLVSGHCEETICLVGDISRLEVSQVSAQQVVVGRSGLPVPLSPMVANILDTFTSTASFSLPASIVLNQLEDGLQQVYLQSCILAEFLLSQDGFHSLQTISSVLDLDPCDVPLLLSVAATHTPSVAHRYGLSFAG